MIPMKGKRCPAAGAAPAAAPVAGHRRGHAVRAVRHGRSGPSAAAEPSCLMPVHRGREEFGGRLRALWEDARLTGTGLASRLGWHGSRTAVVIAAHRWCPSAGPSAAAPAAPPI